MKLVSAKEIVREVLAEYFGDAHVFYAEVGSAQSTDPFVMMQCTSFDSASEFSVDDVVDGTYCSVREYVATFDVNLFTKGKDVSNGRGVPVYLNSSLEDMQDFMDYLRSESGLDMQVKHNVSIRKNGDVRDLSAITNDSRYHYRAMVELSVKFTDARVGYYGQNNVLSLPNDSGGGDMAMVRDGSVIEDADIMYKGN